MDIGIPGILFVVCGVVLIAVYFLKERTSSSLVDWAGVIAFIGLTVLLVREVVIGLQTSFRDVHLGALVCAAICVGLILDSFWPDIREWWEDR